MHSSDKTMISASPMQSAPCGPLSGSHTVPGDKSISHRALILSSQVLGATRISGLLEGEDVIRTSRALSLLGVRILRQEADWIVQGVGVGGFHSPSDVLDMGNAGTGARLMMGLLTPYPFTSFFTGDASLRKRPMKRVLLPLEAMGARYVSQEGGRLPLALTGTSQTLPLEYRMPVASAQVKSAILLAALATAGDTTVIEPEPTRDHTERMLAHFGWDVQINKISGERAVTLAGQQSIPRADRELSVPADPSSAAFLVVAALIVPGSELTIPNVCVNPLRTGLFTTLQEMGAALEMTNPRVSAGEPVADLVVRHSRLKAVRVPASRAPSMIDEYPILAVAASFAEGETVMEGLAELKVKESDRLSAIHAGLEANGVSARIDGDRLLVTGRAKPAGGGIVTTRYDHRIAMSFLVMGMASERSVQIDDGHAIGTSFPGFAELMNAIGGRISLPTQHSAALSTRSRPMTVAIDGPAASGKGTLARRLAEHLGYAYLDTGSIYRAVGLKLIYSGKEPEDEQAAIEAARSLKPEDLANPRLRQERIGKAASIISAIPEVRAILLDFQRHFALGPCGAVLDGRDIGTVVCPDADIKIFITASLEARAKRRHRELQGENIEVVYDSVLDDLRERDERDARRSVAPLIPAADAIILDTSHLDANAVFEATLDIFNHKVEALIARRAAGV